MDTPLADKIEDALRNKPKPRMDVSWEEHIKQRCPVDWSGVESYLTPIFPARVPGETDPEHPF